MSMVNATAATLLAQPDLLRNFGYPLAWVLQVFLGIVGIGSNAHLVVVLFRTKKMDQSVRCLLSNLGAASLLLNVHGTYRASNFLGKLRAGDVGSYTETLLVCQIVAIVRVVCTHVSILSIVCIAVERYVAGVYYYKFNERKALRFSVVAVVLTWLIGLSQQIGNYATSLALDRNTTVFYCLQTSSNPASTVTILSLYFIAEVAAIGFFVHSWLICRKRLAQFKKSKTFTMLHTRLRLRRVTSITSSMAPLVAVHMICYTVMIPGVIISYVQPSVFAASPQTRFLLSEYGTYVSQQLFTVVAVIVCVIYNQVIAEQSRKIWCRGKVSQVFPHSLSVTYIKDTEMHFKHLKNAWGQK